MINDEKWILELEKGENGIISSSENFITIFQNDIGFEALVYNEMTHNVDVVGELPWQRVKKGWTTLDFYNMCIYLEKKYGIYSPNKSKETLLGFLSDKKRFHPIKKFLMDLHWDGIPRVERLLIDFLGAEDSDYVREVTKKTLVAAVARVFEPGIKFDCVLVLVGPQGIGKSTLFRKLARDWYSDSLNLSDLKDKTGAEKLQGIWLMEIGELAEIRKVDVDLLKSFISRSDDKYRHTYGACVESHPRSGIIVGSTNQTDGFLTDITGNRRFWPVRVTGRSVLTVWDLTEKDIEQLWAECVHLYHAKERLYLEDDIRNVAGYEQKCALEKDPRQGIVEAYLNMNLPDNWEEMDAIQRYEFFSGYQDDEEGAERESVCILEIWCECFGKSRADIRRKDSIEIEMMILASGEWYLYPHNNSGKTRIPGYGIQKTFIRGKGE